MNERKIKGILRTHINAVAPHRSNEGVVNACYEKLRDGGHLAKNKVSSLDDKKIVEKMGDGTAYEGE